MSVVPKTWKRKTIGSLCELINGRAFKPTDWGQTGLPIVRIQNLNNAEAKFNYFDGNDVRSRFLIDSGALLFAWSGTPGTSFGAHIWNGGPAILNQHIFNVVFDEDQIDKEFFKLAINQKLDELIDKAHGGVGLRHVTKGRFEETEISLPPISEQRRVVAKLSQFLARSTGAQDELSRVPRLVERYKQAVLENAFRGDLTADWRRQHDVQCPITATRAAIDERVHELDNLPKNWVWQSVGDVAAITGGLTKNPTRNAFPLKMRYLRVANVYANELRLDQIEEIGVTPSEAARVRLAAGDLLIVEGNGSIDQIGRVALWREEIANCGHQNHIIRASPLRGMAPKFLLYWLLSPAGRAAIEVVASSSSGLHTLSISKVRCLPVPVCGEAEMSTIVEGIERRFAAIDAAVQQFSHTTALLKRLEQAILAKAFRGEFRASVPQDSRQSKIAAE